ncbi:CBS domain-containing protein [Portibacter marinus]|uniref:CBS domain-containing protein n=1 Tax=Portibacter marinus TaxID=2898660 RepID=UPI001F2BCA2F|nr:CBS domain-containing protein [Portibacter marinus]
MIIRVGDIMRERPMTLERNASLKNVVKLIQIAGYSHVPITENEQLIGIVSKTDLSARFLRMLNETSGRHYTQMLMNHIPVGDIMHEDPITLKREDDVQYAVELLLQGEFHGLIVVNDEQKVIGIVTAYDLLKSLHIESKV